jgi:queuine tRNA-ribosyltransferase
MVFTIRLTSVRVPGRIRGDRPIHLLGIGGVRDIFNGVRNGIDTFDCVHPTRLGGPLLLHCSAQ